MKKILGSIILFGCILLLTKYTNIFRFSTHNAKLSESYNNVINNSKITVGEIVGRSYDSPYNYAGCIYYYYVDGKRYIGNPYFYSYDDLPENFKPTFEDKQSVKKGNKYLVLYDPARLATQGRDDKSICLLSYPIKDSSDFVKYSKEVEEKILINRSGR